MNNNRFLFFLFILLFSSNFFAQSRLDTIKTVLESKKGYFSKNTAQKYGFYRELIRFPKNKLEVESYKSVGAQNTDWVNFDVNPLFVRSVDSVVFYIENKPITSTKLNKVKCVIILPLMEHDYVISARQHGIEIAKLQVVVFEPKQVNISLVPLVKINSKINSDSIESELNALFSPVNLMFSVKLHAKFNPGKEVLGQFMINPSSGNLKYTAQMQNIRDAYFGKHPHAKKDELLFFLTPLFQDTAIQAFMVKNKALGFLASNGLNELAENIAHQYLTGFINTEHATSLFSKFRLNQKQWIEIYENPQVYSYIDDYEEVVTNNGLIAYYFFEQNEKGEIIIQDNNFLSSIQRPIKKNTFSYHLQIDNFLYQTLFKILNKPFNSLHAVGSLVLVLLLGFLFYRFKVYLKTRFNMVTVFKLVYFAVQWVIIIISVWGYVLLVDLGYSWFEVNNGLIKSYTGLSKSEVLDNLFVNEHPNKIEEKKMGAEIVIKKKNNYFIYERKNVLYFKEVIDSLGKVSKIEFVTSSDTLKTALLPTPLAAKSHYIVVKLFSPNGKWQKDIVYNHLGVNLSEKLNLEDPPKRILLFVNGYRPTSLGASFEDNFADIQKYGLEFPNSLNRIFTDDRYNYWHPWMQIDDLFKTRINPTETYFADGHHSVSTSNHRSLLKFTTFSQVYPKRCADSNHHVCQESQVVGWNFFDAAKKSTYSLLATRPNRKGFQLRQNSGRVAGRNLYQLLNELPNLSVNDTLYIVAHSMGFAYAQGIVEQMRGKINFGGYYIIAPENAKTGQVIRAEWKQIWQYGSNLGLKNQDEPCLQDGIAPQSTVGGLPVNQRITIPQERYNTKGYFDSHFIGWYTWVLQIPEGSKGYVKQN